MLIDALKSYLSNTIKINRFRSCLNEHGMFLSGVQKQACAKMAENEKYDHQTSCLSADFPLTFSLSLLLFFNNSSKLIYKAIYLLELVFFQWWHQGWGHGAPLPPPPRNFEK